MRNIFGLMICGAALVSASACTQLVETGQKATHATRKHIYLGAEKVQELVRYNPEPNVPQSAQSGYCYKAVSDVICYSRPQPHLTNKLVGYQENGEDYYAVPTQQSAPVEPITMSSVHPQGATSPFYIKEAPYVKTDGTIVSSTKMISGDAASYSKASTSVSAAGNPQALMPRY